MMHLQRITRKVPTRVENSYIQLGHNKDRNYLYLRSDHSNSRILSNPKLRRRVDEEIDKEQRELIDLAGTIGHIDPKVSIGSNFCSEEDEENQAFMDGSLMNWKN